MADYSSSLRLPSRGPPPSRLCPSAAYSRPPCPYPSPPLIDRSLTSVAPRPLAVTVCPTPGTVVVPAAPVPVVAVVVVTSPRNSSDSGSVSPSGRPRWLCPLQCGAQYERSSMRSIRRHLTLCFRDCHADMRALDLPAVQRLLKRCVDEGSVRPGFQSWTKRKRPRRLDELQEEDCWSCPMQGCTTRYLRSSSRSINAHLKRCTSSSPATQPSSPASTVTPPLSTCASPAVLPSTPSTPSCSLAELELSVDRDDGALWDEWLPFPASDYLLHPSSLSPLLLHSPPPLSPSSSELSAFSLSSLELGGDELCSESLWLSDYRMDPAGLGSWEGAVR